ncbi:MAG: hypothetical protein Q8K85_15685 [Hyphomicrobium sp.]|nr:hypothetical protein [Hyphomicrobium sp.]
MKKLIVVSLFTVLSMALTAATQATGHDDDQGTVSAFCSDYGDLGLTHGGCVAFFTTRNVVPHDASVCRSDSMQRLLGVANHGQCVKKLAGMRR